MSSRVRQARVALVAAVLATASDFLMLYVANAGRPELGLPEPGRAWLSVGGAVGVLAIPYYGLGYCSAAHLLAGASASGARVVAFAGSAVGLLGGVIHGLTALYLASAIEAGAAGQDPMAAIVESGALMQTLWGVAAVAVGLASLVFALLVARGETALPRSAALANPFFLTLVLGLVGLPTELSRSFLVPAAPNLAHVVFFLVCLRAHVGRKR